MGNTGGSCGGPGLGKQRGGQINESNAWEAFWFECKARVRSVVFQLLPIRPKMLYSSFVVPELQKGESYELQGGFCNQRACCPCIRSRFFGCADDGPQAIWCR